MADEVTTPRGNRFAKVLADDATSGGKCLPSRGDALPRPAGSSPGQSEPSEERLLLVNFGSVAARVGEFGGGWRVILDSGAPAQAEGGGVRVAPRSATILARDTV